MTVYHLKSSAQRLTAALFVLALSGSPALAKGKEPAKAAAPSLVTLGLIDAEADAKLPSITIRLNQKPGWAKLGEMQNHGAFLQLTLPGTIVPEPGKFYEGVSPYLPKIAAFQLTPNDAGIRFFLNQDAAKTKDALSAEVLGERIVLTLDAKKLSSAIAEAKAPALAAAATAGGQDFIEKDLIGPPAPSAVSAEQVIARTQVNDDEPAPSERFKPAATAAAGASDADSSAKALKLAGGGLDLRDKMVRMAVFSAIMMALLLVTWLARPYLKRRRAGSKGDLTAQDNITMKTLATMALAPRQKLSLIQVGNERMLIGISPDQITFLSTIGANNPAAPQAGAMRVQPSQARAFAQELPPEFTKMLSAPEPVEMSPAPVLKNLPGNDPESLAPPPRRALARPPTPSPHGAPPRAKRAPVSGQRINIGVGENGIEDMTQRSTPRAEPRAQTPAEAPKKSQEAYAATGDGQKAIDDVTRLIREKLKNLRTI